jgi:uncharacterized protein
MGPLLTLEVHLALRTAALDKLSSVECSLDLGRSTRTVDVGESGWDWEGQLLPWFDSCKDRTIYYWIDKSFQPVARFTTSLIKLVPTKWGPPTFEIDGIKMLPSARVSPYADAQRKVGLIEPHGKVILDTCGGLGYFAAWCVADRAKQVISFEKNPDVIWLRTLNPWSPQVGSGLTLIQGDIAEEIALMQNESLDSVLHDPPRFGIAGELYSQAFYLQLARVMRRKGKLFHYTGTPNKLSSGRDMPNEVAKRLQRAGFSTHLEGDGVLAIKR